MSKQFSKILEQEIEAIRHQSDCRPEQALVYILKNNLLEQDDEKPQQADTHSKKIDEQGQNHSIRLQA